MCGIIAFSNTNQIDKDIFAKMRDSLSHRGPDDYGDFFSRNGRLALGHRRLSIIDLSSTARQPICNENMTIWLSFNGEIYNFGELRETLERKGHRFRSKTDSEVIVHAYEEWSEACVERLWGMFAFVLWDESNQVLFGARDRLGVKPLHYYHAGDRFICASEIKAIIQNPDVPRRLDLSALCDFFTYRYIPAPKTVWLEIRKLPPAHAFRFSANGLRIWRYWSLQPRNESIPADEVSEHLKELLGDAVGRRLVSDVPVGLFLSGGLDSTAIGWQMKRFDRDIKSFTIGFEGQENDETPDAELIAHHLNTHHQARHFSERAMESLHEMMYFFDEPFGASSMLPTFLLCKVARESVKVALSGDGGDEAFAGYGWYDALLESDKARRAKHWLLRLRWGRNGRKHRLAERYRQKTTPRFSRHELRQLFGEPLKGIEPDELWFIKEAINPELSGIKQLQWLDIHTFLPEEVLTKVDRASMANALEVRSPFLDHRFFEWVFSLSEDIFFAGEKKKLIKDLLRDDIPAAIIAKKKQGFSAPVRSYWHDERVNGMLSESRAVSDGLFKGSFVDHLLVHPNANATFPHRWLLLVFEFWYRRWMIRS